jgi:hypothetical protein
VLLGKKRGGKELDYTLQVWLGAGCAGAMLNWCTSPVTLSLTQRVKGFVSMQSACFGPRLKDLELFGKRPAPVLVVLR